MKLNELSGALKNSVSEILAAAESRLTEVHDMVKIGNFDLVALDWAGIGDACCHSRLILQHIAMHKKVAWITIPLVADLFRNDSLFSVFSGFSCPYRDVSIEWVCQLSEEINNLFVRIFKPIPLLHISNEVVRFYSSWDRSNYSNLFFGACKIKRDFSILHQIEHKGNINEIDIRLPHKYVVLEHSGKTCGKLELNLCHLLYKHLDYKNIGMVYLGSKNDPYISVGVDARGMSLYDSMTIIKNSIGFIGRSSGNQSLTCFCRHVPIFEIDVPDVCSYATCRLHGNVKKIVIEDFIKYIISEL